MVGVIPVPKAGYASKDLPADNRHDLLSPSATRVSISFSIQGVFIGPENQTDSPSDLCSKFLGMKVTGEHENTDLNLLTYSFLQDGGVRFLDSQINGAAYILQPT